MRPGHTHTQDNYRNPRCACAPRVNKSNGNSVLLHYLPCVRMDKKGGDNDVIYPDIMFCVDGFEEVYIIIIPTSTLILCRYP